MSGAQIYKDINILGCMKCIIQNSSILIVCIYVVKALLLKKKKDL